MGRTDLLTYPRARTWNASGGTSSPPRRRAASHARIRSPVV